MKTLENKQRFLTNGKRDIDIENDFAKMIDKIKKQAIKEHKNNLK